jgi:hypothetical protein
MESKQPFFMLSRMFSRVPAFVRSVVLLAGLRRGNIGSALGSKRV